MPQTQIRRFEVGRTMEGHVVLDSETGRQLQPVVGAYATAQEANGAAYKLHRALANGPKALARALRATDDPTGRW